MTKNIVLNAVVAANIFSLSSVSFAAKGDDIRKALIGAGYKSCAIDQVLGQAPPKVFQRTLYNHDQKQAQAIVKIMEGYGCKKVTSVSGRFEKADKDMTALVPSTEDSLTTPFAKSKAQPTPITHYSTIFSEDCSLAGVSACEFHKTRIDGKDVANRFAIREQTELDGPINLCLSAEVAAKHAGVKYNVNAVEASSISQ